MTQPVPEGFSTITPSIALKNCQDMIETYRDAFDAKLLDKTMCPETGKVMHATLQIGTSKLMVSDEFPNCPSAKGASFYLYVPNCDATMKQAKEAGLKETMAAEDMFWGDRLGAVTDACGIQWSIATHVKDVSKDDLEKGAKEMAKRMKEAQAQKAA